MSELGVLNRGWAQGCICTAAVQDDLSGFTIDLVPLSIVNLHK